ncbi:ABC-type phosphate/phosphonate transport system substrate-binding protein [Sphingomonas sp. PP-CE-1A-559]|uniref:phosphate/phosphite/phosphonate ABC transporter substrate-binding protein n=1 Tax=Sphingomonas sp. PP-CE-1A-559 TaxID=2135657 RepID=UPI00105447C5|nr:PhnD/SsuA/transferrin family substrate-binding protein [Sphingomonas sp. PP-CE-1A-559]TCP93012.1 ABC-type phosphate/phosphonate transport system substrate-binding protein [Sphingomonas sp. PP-CE-1A-559]
MTDRIASLGMYDHLEQHAANDRLWSAIAAVLRERGVADVPARLDRTRDVHAIWRDPALLFGQACGYPLIADPTLDLQVIAFPIYAGRESGSVIVARADDPRRAVAAFRDSRAAINDRQSNTGMNLFRATIAPFAGQGAFFAEVLETGAHRASIVAVGMGKVDLAAIDSVTYAAIARFEPALVTGLKIVAPSPASPSLPFVTAAGTDAETVAALQSALDHVAADPDLAAVRETLLLAGIIPAEPDALAPISTLEAEAVRAGYRTLR